MRKFQLAHLLGYCNTARGLRRIDAILDAELDEELTRRVARVLMISRAELERALADQRARKEEERLQVQARERAAFRRCLTLIRAYDPPSIQARQGWRLASQIPLPALAANTPWTDECAEAVHYFRSWLDDQPPDSGPDLQLSGFYYHRSYDHGFLFDAEANMIREEQHHVSPSSIYIIPVVEIELDDLGGRNHDPSNTSRPKQGESNE